MGAADAYSTLGWFDDPVLSTMISEGDEAVGELVNVILHESVHATLYIDGQTRFNESLAEYSAGLIALSGCLQGEVAARIVDNDLEGAKESVAAFRDIFTNTPLAGHLAAKGGYIPGVASLVGLAPIRPTAA